MAIAAGAVEGLAVIDADFWRGRRVLITGHTGFKGSWLAIWLSRLGAQVSGVALPPSTTPSLFDLARIRELVDGHVCDIRDAVRLRAVVRNADPEVVFHLAAQPLVRASYREPVTTFSTNVMGTVHVLEALRGLASLRVAVMVTTDKVYRNREWAYAYREDDALGGHDPYSASKAASEIALACYRDSFLAPQGVALASARAGNVIGGGDWSEDRLLPDAVRAWSRGQVLEIRRPEAMRPWQHVLEPLAGYLTLARRLWDDPGLAGAWNFGPASDEAASVRTLVDMAARDWQGARTRFAALEHGQHEAGCLALEVGKARAGLGVRPRWSLALAVPKTMAWYSRVAAGADARTQCQADLADYEVLLA